MSLLEAKCCYTQCHRTGGEVNMILLCGSHLELLGLERMAIDRIGTWHEEKKDVVKM